MAIITKFFEIEQLVIKVLTMTCEQIVLKDFYVDIYVYIHVIYIYYVYTIMLCIYIIYTYTHTHSTCQFFKTELQFKKFQNPCAIFTFAQ